MLRSSGAGVFLNSNAAPASTALFPDDVIATRKDSAARIELAGSSADIGPDTIVQYQNEELVLDHGTVSVNTSRGLRVRVGCLLVTPVHDATWTHYDVTDVNGRMTVSALKSDAYIDARSKKEKKIEQESRTSREIVRETEQKSREDKCGGAYLNPSDSPAGRGAILNSPWAKLTGGVSIGVLTCWAVCRSDDPISPKWP